MSPKEAAPVSCYDVDRDALAGVLSDQASYRVDQVWDGLYTQAAEFEEMTNLSKALRQRLVDELPSSLSPAAESVSEDGDTVKWLWDLHDGKQVETVLMRYRDRATVCVSTQAGCAMACGFCATGQAGFDRHLTVGEVVEQVIRSIRRARPDRVSNVVLMGMGEPLANYSTSVEALRRFHGALGLSARHLTLSTVGLVPGIRRLAEEDLPITLAVSLHAGNDELRNELVPINKRHPLGELVEACIDYRTATNRRVSFEWALIDGVNDRDSDADELAELARQARAHVNLIPLNPTPGYPTVGTPPARVQAFADRLSSRGTNATVRKNRGTSIDAACGQLRANRNESSAAPVTLQPKPKRPATS